ncbi:MAG: alpha-amylase family glycosyl hydrolase [Acidobacteriota bacterium]|nr:alpha-amylase family glycosyl hydrolase [Blastocatellia bacterium]MDW8411128.1 alpha-amylase family glycosyl hydrolase [Acidobacteriota bacterium]
MRKLLLCLACLVCIASWQFFQAIAVSGPPPVVEKIEPPSWWTEHTLNTIQLIIKGSGFQGAELRSAASGLKVLNYSVNDKGNYITASIYIDPERSLVGTNRLVIVTPFGQKTIDYQLDPPIETKGRFAGFSPDDVIYLIMIDRFSDGDLTNNDPPESAGFYDRSSQRKYHGGDLQGVIDRLPYLKDLGITAIWLTPIYENSDKAADYHGYHSVDHYGVEEHFGTLDKFKELVEKAHALGIKVIQDQILNHVGPNHPFVDDPPFPGFFNGTRDNHLTNPFDIYSLTIPNADPKRVEATLRGWFAGILPDLNQDTPAVGQYLIQHSLWWVGQTGIDGIRLDTYPYVPRSYYPSWHGAIRKQFPNLTVVGEILDGRPGVVAFFQGGQKQFDGIDTGLDTAFDFPFCFAIRDYFAQNQPSRFSELLAADSVYPRPGVLVPLFNNHDIPRMANEAGFTASKQILAFTFLLTMRGTPQVYYGDEIGMKGGNDPDNRRDFPGGFPEDPRNAFTREGRTEQEQKIFSAVQQLLQIRQKTPALRGGQMQILSDGNQLAYLRTNNGDRAIVAINNTDQSANWKVKLPQGLFAEGSKLVDLLNPSNTATVKKSRLRIKLPARSAAIYK